ncbi:hypothetical protein I7X12_02825 [Halosimplex litoreum]|uniref:DUF8120 domain-containing protein n=1 Tax=Halosimplex litoreum TaxID=1198301 RepID=A0A7T3KVQ2_9EURY|nr:hypothetical protein [Halosimplex litoreum]QPV63584.1 hypothetical protein I7X12_02825 [Halosimplex litoreum]
MSAVTVSARSYRWIDRLSKLLGVALIAAGLDTGGHTPAGIAFAAAGVACGLATIFVSKQ